MKKLLLGMLAVVFLLTAGCKKEVDKLLTFYIEDQETMEISTGFPFNTLANVAIIPITTDSEQDFANNDTRADLVKDVSLNQLKLTIVNPANEDFSFLKNIRIYISTDGADEVIIASSADVTTNAGNTIKLISTNAKLDKYIKASTYRLRPEAILD